MQIWYPWSSILLDLLGSLRTLAIVQVLQTEDSAEFLTAA